MSQTEESIGSPKLFQRDGVPPIKDLLPTSLQHVLACFAGAIAPAMMIASTCNFTPEQEQAIIQVALILTALDTLLQQFPIFGRIGSNLPIITGVSFAFLPAFQAIGFEFGFGTLLGAELVGGVVAILFGLSNFGKGVIKLGAIFFGMIAGCLISIPLGMIDPSGIADAAWFALPQPMPFKIEFNGAACLTIAVVYIMANVQLIGDLSAATLGALDRLPEEKELSGAIMAQGTVSIVSSFFGGMPTSAFGQNVGIIVSNKVVNRWVFAFAAAIFAVAGFVPKVAGVLTMIPQPVIGGATISVFGTITLNGIRMLVRDGLTPRSCTVFGVSVAFGLGIAQVSGCLSGAGMPDWVSTIFATSAITPCAIMAIILNNVLPPEEVPMPSDTNGPNDLRVEAAAAVDAQDVDVDTLEVVSRDGEEIGEVGVMFDAAERMATYEDKNTDGGADGASVKK